MARILFFGPFNQRSRDTESLMIAFREQGHRVFMLTMAEGNQISDFLKGKGIEVESCASPLSGWLGHVRNVYYLTRFCWNQRIDVVYCHLEPANFVGAIAQFFATARFYICRHHQEQYQLLGIDKSFSYRLTYRLARRIIVYSRATKQYLIENEGIPERKIVQTNLAYDFSLYNHRPNTLAKQFLKETQAEVLLITVGSFVPLKRPELSLQVLRMLVDAHCDARLILLGRGELQASISKLAESLGIAERVWMPGYVENVLDYLAISTFLIHPSVSESSCVVVKEAGLVNKSVIVCRGVGDFDEYIQSGKNGFLVDSHTFVEEAVRIILEYKNTPIRLDEIGKYLRSVVLDHFGVKRMMALYDELNSVK